MKGVDRVRRLFRRKEPEQVLFRIIGISAYVVPRALAKDRLSITVGQVYDAPVSDHETRRARCLDWFQPFGDPALTIYVFERV